MDDQFKGLFLPLILIYQAADTECCVAIEMDYLQAVVTENM